MVKSVFVMAFITAANVFTVLAAVKLVGGFEIAWLGTLLANAPIALFFGSLMMLKPTARTGAHIPAIIAMVIAGVAVAVYGYLHAAEPEPLALGGAALGAAGWLLYDFWYSKLQRAEAPALAVGNELPNFNLETAAGAAVESGSFRDRPTLLMFYRGNWCPFCVAQIRELAEEYRELEARGVRVIFVSPQPHGNSESIAGRFDIPAEFLVDADNAAARLLGIAHEAGLPAGMQALGYATDTVFPTVIITDSAGRIIFADQTDNYRVRPEPATFLRAMDEAGIIAASA